MKITNGHYKILSRYIDAGLTEYFSRGNSWEGLKYHYSHVVAKEDNVKDVWKRFRWDLFWHAKKINEDMCGFIDELYKYLDDTHIDASLKKKVVELDKKFSQNG